jgi:hypothetical protein
MIAVFRRLFTSALVIAALIGAPARPAFAIADGEDAADSAYRFSVLLTMTGLPADGGGTARQLVLGRPRRTPLGDHRGALLPSPPTAST